MQSKLYQVREFKANAGARAEDVPEIITGTTFSPLIFFFFLSLFLSPQNLMMIINGKESKGFE